VRAFVAMRLVLLVTLASCQSFVLLGGNASGQLGNGSATASTVPVAAGATSGVVSGAAGGSLTCALTNDRIQCLGCERSRRAR
jgi:hypothetical protein